MTSLRTSLPLLAIALLLGACTSAPREAAQAAPAPAATTAPKDNPKNLRKGMTEHEIRAVWGEPKAVHAGQEGETILVYQFDVLTTQRMVAAAMTEVPAVDMVTGEARTVLEPTLTPQNVTITQTIVLQLKNGALASWARRLGEQRSFN
jgi:PBP1b-binding outer membrane lipoprotein LpoB